MSIDVKDKFMQIIHLIHYDYIHDTFIPKLRFKVRRIRNIQLCLAWLCFFNLETLDRSNITIMGTFYLTTSVIILIPLTTYESQ